MGKPLHDQLCKAEDTIAALRRENDALSAKVCALNTSNAKLRREVLRLKSDNRKDNDFADAEFTRLRAERDEARSDIAAMVAKAADKNLDGYRELGERAACAENERDEARAQVAAMGEALKEIRDGIQRVAREKNEDTRFDMESVVVRINAALSPRPVVAVVEGYIERGDEQGDTFTKDPMERGDGWLGEDVPVTRIIVSRESGSGEGED